MSRSKRVQTAGIDVARKQIDSNTEELRATFDRYKDQRSKLDPDLGADLQGFLVVRMAGALEQATFLSIDGYMFEQTDGTAREFASSWFYRAPSLKAKEYQQLIARFGPPISDNFKRFLDVGLRREELDGLMNVRHDVAHGKSYSSSYAKLTTYLLLVEELTEWLKANLL